MKLNDNLLNAGVELMLAGMGTVFLFLTLLVGATMLMSVLVQRWFVPVALSEGKAANGLGSDPSTEELAAISAAIHQHRSSSNKR